MLGRAKDKLHEQVDSTTLLVLQVQRGRQYQNFVFSAGDPGAGDRRETLCFEHVEESDAMQGCLRWVSPAQNNENNVYDPLQIAADGRFAIVMICAAGESSSLEVQDGLGDVLGVNRKMPDHPAVSNRCGQGYCLGGQKPDQPQSGYDGQIAEVLVYNRALSSAERRALVAYLRRKYELDVLDALFSAGTQLMQAEDFDGPWQFIPHRDSSATHVGAGHSMQRTVLISRPGNYRVWLRA